MFCITDVQAVLSGPVGTIAPFPQLIYNVSGGDMHATVGVSCFMLVLSLVVGGPSVLTATSRIVWSFAKEGALPPLFGEVNTYFDVPVNAILLVSAIISAMSFIYVGNTTAFYSISSGVTAVMIFSYSFPIMIDLLCCMRKNRLQPGSFRLGRLKTPVNVMAVCWSVYLIIFMCFPTSMPVTKANMNYTVVIFTFPFVLAGLSWVLYGRRTYQGVIVDFGYITGQETTEGVEAGSGKSE